MAKRDCPLFIEVKRLITDHSLLTTRKNKTNRHETPTAIDICYFIYCLFKR